MKRVARWSLVFLALTLSGFAVPPKVGMTESELLEIKGAPTTKAALGPKSIYRWPDMQVTLVEGKIAEIQFRDLKAEKKNSAERAEADAQKSADAKRAAFEAQKKEKEATAAATKAEESKDRRLERTVILQSYIASMERELADDAKRSSFGKGPPPMSAEAKGLLTLRIAEAKREIETLR